MTLAQRHLLLRLQRKGAGPRRAVVTPTTGYALRGPGSGEVGPTDDPYAVDVDDYPGDFAGAAGGNAWANLRLRHGGLGDLPPPLPDASAAQMPPLELSTGEKALVIGGLALGAALAVGGLVWKFYAVHEAAETASKFAPLRGATIYYVHANSARGDTHYTLSFRSKSAAERFASKARRNGEHARVQVVHE